MIGLGMNGNGKHIVTSSDGRFAVEFGEDFGEIRMGSPEFGEIRLVNMAGAQKPKSVIEFGEKLFGGAVVFSPDSRFVALEQLLREPKFRTQVIVVELERPKIYFVDAPAVGAATPVRWEHGNKLIYRVNEFLGAPAERTWEPPF